MKAEIYYSGLVIWEGEVKDNTDPAITLESLFERFNIGDHGGLKIRSMSVGDIVKLDNTYYRCASMGWEVYEM